MAAYLLRRVALMVLVLFGVTTIVFFLSHVVPSDPIRMALGEQATQEMIDKYARERGLDKPLIIQYGIYLSHALRGDLGTSILTRQKVTDDFARFLPATIELMIPSLIISLSVGLFLGVTAAVRRGHWFDHASRLLSLFGMSMPIFWLGLVLQVLFYKRLGLFPYGGRLDIDLLPPPFVTGLYTVDSLLVGRWDLFLNALKHLILPAFALSMIELALMARITRTSLLDELNADYVRTARAKGLPQRAVIYAHALRNALIPVVTILGMRIGHLFGGAVLVETVFAWPGIGRWAVTGLRWLDFPVVMGFTLWICFMFTVINILVDVSYTFLDPRLRVS